jgi:hypothetical protein
MTILQKVFESKSPITAHLTRFIATSDYFNFLLKFYKQLF